MQINYDTKIEIDVILANGKLYFFIKKNSICFISVIFYFIILLGLNVLSYNGYNAFVNVFFSSINN